ncbi:YeaC family protein [Pseudidiomarina sp.]|uniref:YeaC family protein n=1 Tax=Pseudidiomarina sp. TaxID=2081707 RepID=UPI003A96FF0A
MQFDDLLSSITPETFERLVQAVELGKWPDGVKLTEQQREHSIQLVMAYQARYTPSDEAFRIGADGQLVTRSKRDMKAEIKPADTIASFPLNSSSEAS